MSRRLLDLTSGAPLASAGSSAAAPGKLTKLLLLDPGLRTRLGHNAAFFAELDVELRALRRVQLSAACSAYLEPAELAGCACVPRPLFRLDGYRRPTAQEVLDPAQLDGLIATIVEDLAQLPLEELDGLLMPTGYPLHVIALSRVAQRLSRARLMLGLLMPISFWVPDEPARATLGEHLGQAITTLRQTCELLVYSETGRYDFGGVQATMATLLLPLARPTLQLAAALAAGSASGDGRCVFGFFGQPFKSKGFDLVAAAARSLDPGRVTVRFRLPPGHEGLCRELVAWAPAIEATSQAMDNAEYLRQMAAVDVVLACYDPQAYGEKMSGVVAEAIMLAKPLVVSDGCRALIGFLDRYAPGAFATGGYHAADLSALMALPAATWRAIGARARASSAVVRELKSMRRYLGVGRLDGAYPAPRSKRAAP